MNLLVGFYNDATPARTDEFIECIRRNAANPHIDSIRLFIEDPVSPADVQSRFPTLSHTKVHFVGHGHRLTYSHLFEYANRHLTGAGVIIANADIFFDESLALLDGYDLQGKLLCLSRWDVQADGSASFFEHPASQDAWIFRAPVPDSPVAFHSACQAVKTALLGRPNGPV